MLTLIGNTDKNLPIDNNSIIIDAGKIVPDEVKSKQEKNERDAHLIRTSNELTNTNIFAFLFAMFMGDADDATIDKISEVLGLGDNLKQTVNSVRSGSMNAAYAAAKTYSSIDTKSIDWGKASSIINDDTYQGFIDHLKLREGVRNDVYTDSEGHLTVGVGHRVKPSNNLRKGDVISGDRLTEFLEQDSIAAYNRAKLQADELGINDKEVIAGLASVNFQLGLDWNKEHKKTWAFMKQGKFKETIPEAADSNWNDQTPIRVKDFQKILARADAITNGTIIAESPENTHMASLRLDSSSEASLSNRILRVSQTDNAYGGYCAKGAGNIFENLGVDITRGNAHTWIDSLPKNGWIKLENIDPKNAPIGSAIVYDRNTNYSGRKGGSEFGHIETPVNGDNGERLYVSDKARSNWGGTVPQNFAGVFVHPDIHGDIIASLTEKPETKTGLSNTFANADGENNHIQASKSGLSGGFDRESFATAEQIKEKAEQIAELDNGILGQKPAPTHDTANIVI